MFGNTALAYDFREPRDNVRFAVYYGMRKFGPITNYTVNMSLGGVFIETNDVLPAGTEFDVDFMLPDRSALISCRARVAWTNEQGKAKNANLPAGMGLHFLDLSFRHLRTIRDHLETGSLVPVW